MKTPKAVNKRASILQAAAKVLAQKGYSLTTLADIAAEAGTFAGSLYYYFTSKEKMVEEVLNIGTTSVSSRVVSRVRSLPEGMPAYDKVRIALEEHLQQMLKKDDFVVAYWRIIDQVPEEIREKHLSLPREYGQFWQDMLQTAQITGEIRQDIDTRLLRLLLIGSTIYALQWFKPHGRNTPQEIADTLAEMFFRGMVPRPTGNGIGPASRSTPTARARKTKREATGMPDFETASAQKREPRRRSSPKLGAKLNVSLHPPLAVTQDMSTELEVGKKKEPRSSRSKVGSVSASVGDISSDEKNVAPRAEKITSRRRAIKSARKTAQSVP
jgi:AcrR family transcriptional regulator